MFCRPALIIISTQQQNVYQQNVYITIGLPPLFIVYVLLSLLQDVNPDPPSTDPNATALTWVSYIGSILSVISLIITIITYLAEK